MKKKVYSNKIIKKVLNAYMQAIYRHETQEIFVDKVISIGHIDFAIWLDSQIILVMKDQTASRIPLKKLKTNDSNIVIESLMEALIRDMQYYRYFP